MMDTPRGFSIPFGFDASGRVATVSGAAKLRENIILAILTVQGERPRRRGHGGSLWAMRHEPMNPAILTLARRRILQAVRDAEPRVEIVDLRIAPDPGAEGVLLVDVDFVERRTQQPGQLSIPLTLA